MCGIPYHAASTYISKILEAGKKVALCEQVEEATPGKLVKRAVTQILTPGSHFDDKLLRPDANNYLVSLMRSNQLYGLAMVDLTTGDFALRLFQISRLLFQSYLALVLQKSSFLARTSTSLLSQRINGSSFHPMTIGRSRKNRPRAFSWITSR